MVENIEDSASGCLVEGMHALMAEFYSANLASKVKKGIIQKANRESARGLKNPGPGR